MVTIRFIYSILCTILTWWLLKFEPILKALNFLFSPAHILGMFLYFSSFYFVNALTDFHGYIWLYGCNALTSILVLQGINILFLPYLYVPVKIFPYFLFLLCSFLSTQRIPIDISCRSGLVFMNLTFFFFVRETSILICYTAKLSFFGYRCFPFSILSISCLKSVDSLVGFPLYVTVFSC